MKQIKLTLGKVALVDNEDFEFLRRWKWFAIKKRYVYYARRSKIIKGKQITIYMHRLILNTPKNKQIDHKDGNGLNNQKYNLRKCTNSENSKNQRLRKNNKSGYKGVYWAQREKKWIVGIRVNYESFYLGSFKNIIDAARCYDENAIKYHGEFASLNFK